MRMWQEINVLEDWQSHDTNTLFRDSGESEEGQMNFFSNHSNFLLISLEGEKKKKPTITRTFVRKALNSDGKA